MRRVLRGLAIAALVAVIVFAFVGCDAKIVDNYDEAFFDEMRAEDNSMADGANVRVMSANVLVHMKEGWGGSPVSPRAEIFAEALKHYAPDVVGLQEFCGCFYNEMPKRSPEYKLLTTKKSDYTSMMYNANKVKVVANGIKRYSKQSNKNCRFVVWGVFEKLETGEKFGVTSTHWDFGMEEKKQKIRRVQVEEQTEVINMMVAEYNVPVFAVGDFNVYEFSEEYCAQSYRDLIQIAQVVDAKFALGESKTMLGASNNIAKFEKESWDHIFIKGDVTPLLFNILYNTKYYESLTDHPLIYLDALLK